MSAKRTDNKGRVLRTGESQRKDLTYMYRYTDKWGDRRTIYAPTLQELREKEKQITVAEVQGRRMFEKIKLNELMERYCKLSESQRDTTLEHYNILRNMVNRYSISQKVVGDIKTSEAKLWVMDLQKDGYAPSTIRDVARFCKRVCRIALEDEIIMRNPFDFDLSFLQPNNKRNALTDIEQHEFLEFIKADWKSLPYYDYVVFLLETGLRLGELRGLTKSDINLTNHTVTVSHQLKGRGPQTWRIDAPKSDAGIRTIPLSKKAHQAITRIIERADRAKCDTVIDGYSGFITLGKSGSIIGDNALDLAIKGICDRYERANGKSIRVTPHILRHTFCTNMHRKGLSVTSLQYLMGHSDPSTTMNVYTHHDPTYAMEESRKLLDELTPIYTTA